MNLFELQEAVNMAVKKVGDAGESSESVLVSIQIDNEKGESLCAADIEAIYDNNLQASGFVLLGLIDE